MSWCQRLSIRCAKKSTHSKVCLGLLYTYEKHKQFYEFPRLRIECLALKKKNKKTN